MLQTFLMSTGTLQADLKLTSWKIFLKLPISLFQFFLTSDTETKQAHLNLPAMLQIRSGKIDYLGIVFRNSFKTYVVTHHKKRLIKMVLMRGYNICFH